ncbi:metallophosphoesterase [candidate division KSB1 bacterium]|nr:metallophosphoesterase [candidate division KSB1 bacterium]
MSKYALPLFLITTLLLFSCKQHYDTVKIGMCSDVHLPTMHDSEYRITTFIDSMKSAQPDFIIELGDFGTPAEKYAPFFAIWNSFPGERYHVIGNHEMDGGYSKEQAVAYRHMPNSYYTFEKNNFHFIVLDGNDPKSENERGYKQYIGERQIKWLNNELANTKHPVVIFSHQGLTTYPGGEEEDYGVENNDQIRAIFEAHNKSHPAQKVIACFNGHTHYDYAENVNGIWYITINSMSYQWMGEAYEHIRYSEEIDKKFKWLKYTAPHKEPLFTIVEISSQGYIKIHGKQTEWVGPSPWEVGYPETLEKYVRPAISGRYLEFQLQ